MNFLDTIIARGFVHQLTDEAGLRAYLAEGDAAQKRAYIGFDCTGKSLHVGSLIQIMLLYWWQKCGHTPIVLLGGGTTKIGDPSGKDESRPPLTDETINANMNSLRDVFSRFLDFSGNQAPENPALMVNNDDWLRGLNYVEFLRDYGRHFSVNRMLSMDSVKLRLEREQPLSFLEFNYMILQAYDFVELNSLHGCRVQMGGSDQWGNIVSGIELHRRASFSKGSQSEDLKTVASEVKQYIETQELFGITTPLLTTSSGAKMGKTAAGAVWLNADMLKPYDYWQFWRNTEDGDVIRFLKLFTDLKLEQIAEYESWIGTARINEAKISLATEATALLHGREEAEKARQAAADTFGGKGVSADLPELTIDAAALSAGVPVYELLVRAGLAESNGEAKRLIKGNGISVNDVRVANESAKLQAADLGAGYAKLSKGKKQHVLIRAVS